MGGYLLPAGNVFVSDTWQGHRDRNPPSQEPGTDYASAPGTPLVAVGAGVVVDVQTSPANATGRFITIDLDDGRRTRSLHLATVDVRLNSRVSRGQRIGTTGASANGSNNGVGAHVHQSLWPTHRYVFGPNGTIDFQPFVGSPEPEPEPQPDTEEDEGMRVIFGGRSEGNPEWMIVHPDLSDASGRQGFQVTTDQNVAIAWSRMYAKGFSATGEGFDFWVNRDGYVAIQRQAEAVRARMSTTAAELPTTTTTTTATPKAAHSELVLPAWVGVLGVLTIDGVLLYRAITGT